MDPQVNLPNFQDDAPERLLPLHPRQSPPQKAVTDAAAAAQPPNRPPNTTSNVVTSSSSKGNSHRQTPISCKLCRRRKVKCDRAHPCGNCVRAGAECVPTVPSRAPRGRQGGRKRKEAEGELLERIAKLENLVRDIEGQEGINGEGAVAIVGRNSGSDTVSATERPLGVAMSYDAQDQLSGSSGGAQRGEAAGAYRTPPPVKKLDRYLGSSFWLTLSEEINGLKDVLGGSSDEEDEGEGEGTPASDLSSGGQEQRNHSGFVLSRPMTTETVIHPTRHQVYTFCETYLANVDLVFKILHAPSLRRYLQEDAAELDCSPGPGGLEALRFAIYYAATVSMTDGECKNRTGEDKAVLLARYRAGTELALAKADFVNTIEMSTLQALSIYLVSVRVNDNSRRTWTLTSLAVRIAQAMDLHHENTLSSVRPFDREMRRRLWWQICLLDSHAAGDRASNPIISADSFNTKLPLMINDDDLHVASSEGLTEQAGFTDMTFSLICNEISDTDRQLNYVPARELTQPQNRTREKWYERIDMVINVQRHIEESYLRHLNLAHPFHWWTRLVADVIMSSLWLFVYRPLQQRPESKPTRIADPGILRLSVEVLERAYQINTDPAASPFRWLSQTYVQWHALAVTTAELCVRTEGPLVERAWAIIEILFEETAQHVADSNKGMLWRPIKKLMNRAQGVRKKYLDSHSATARLSATTAPMNVPDPGNHLANTGDAMFNFNDYVPEPVEGGTYSMEGLQQTPYIPTSLPLDWDPWLAAATTTMPNQSQYNSDINQMAWTNWEDFINDFQGQDDVRSGPNTVRAPGSSSFGS